jgi:hypothetical protein
VNAGIETEPSADILDLVRSVGERVVVLHSPSSEGLSGRDIDCAVEGLDPLWPLRLRQGWRLCQYSQYDLRGWFWVLERDGQLLHLDTIDDRLGLGRDGFPTAGVVGTPQLPPTTRAAYLAIKRLRKGTRDEREWIRIRELASSHWDGFRSALYDLAGPGLGSTLFEAVREGRLLGEREWRRARSLQAARRFRSPTRALTAILLQARRVLDRAAHPTGWSVLIVGPDGAGKSTLARELVETLSGVFRRDAVFHWRPGILPRPGALVGQDRPDSSMPHDRPVHGKLISLGLLAYHWLDFLIGGWLRVWPVRVRTGLVVTERGWWDLVVDPRRYRLDVPPWLVRALGAPLHHPDVTFLLEAPSDVLRARKRELPAAELDRQRTAWRTGLPGGVPVVPVDASAGPEDVLAHTREHSFRLLESRAARRLGAGWTQLRRRGQLRWWFPRGPSSVAAGAFTIYQPVTVLGRVAWEMTRMLGRAGVLRLLPRTEAPPHHVREVMAPHLPAGATLAVGRANHPGRYVAAILMQDGSCRGVAKVASDDAGRAALQREAKAIADFGPMLRAPVYAPAVLANDLGVLLLEAVPWMPRARPWRLDPEVAQALGTLFRGGTSEAGPSHGDCAPWNLLRTDGGWVLVDWESAKADGSPFHDLCHYLVQAHTLLGRPSWVEIRSGFLDGEGWIGQAVRAYAEGAGVPATDGWSHLLSYMARRRSSSGQPEDSDRQHRPDLVVRGL